MSSEEPGQSEIGQRREEYAKSGGLSEEQAGDDPIALFEKWFDEACEAAEAGPAYEPNVMTLATVSEDGRPDARIVLLKSFDARGFAFYTNYESRKGRELAAWPYAALVFHWITQERQVRIEGEVERVSRAESEAYFATRPRGSQLGAWVSEQSEATSKEKMRDNLAALESQYADQQVPCPPHWGGYRVKPDRIEFWQGQRNRLHDRILFTRGDEGVWERSRLAP